MIRFFRKLIFYLDIGYFFFFNSNKDELQQYLTIITAFALSDQVMIREEHGRITQL
jgi:hypothetical protein